MPLRRVLLPRVSPTGGWRPWKNPIAAVLQDIVDKRRRGDLALLHEVGVDIVDAVRCIGGDVVVAEVRAAGEDLLVTQIGQVGWGVLFAVLSPWREKL